MYIANLGPFTVRANANDDAAASEGRCNLVSIVVHNLNRRHNRRSAPSNLRLIAKLNFLSTFEAIFLKFFSCTFYRFQHLFLRNLQNFTYILGKILT